MDRAVGGKIENLLSRGRVAFLLFLLVFFSYFGSLDNEFVWDDHIQIIENQFIRDFKNIPSVLNKGNSSAFSGQFEVQYYRPAQVLTYLLDYFVWHLNPFGFHLTNILLHYLNSLLAFLLIYSISRNKIISLVVSIIFCVHPLNVSSVSYISGRADLIVTLFILLSFIYWVRAVSANRYWLLSLLFFSLALMAKEIAIVLPFLFLIYAFSFSDKYGSLSRRFIKVIPFFVILLIYFLIRKYAFGNIKLETINIPLIPFLSTVCKIFFLYIKLLFVPDKLYMGHDTNVAYALFSPFNFFCIVFISLFIFLTLKIYRLSKENFFFAFWFVLFLLPVFFTMHADYLHRVLMAEHWAYIPSIGIYFITANSISLFITKVKLGSYLYEKYKFIFWVFFIFIISIYMAVTIKSNQYWKNDLILANYTLRSSFPNRFYNWKIYNNLGKINEDLKNYPEARRNFKQALHIALLGGSEYIKARMYYSIANVDCSEARYDSALSGYKKAIETFPGIDSFFAGLGFAYIMLNDRENALFALREALKINPYNKNARYNLTTLLNKSGSIE